jgi:hypothetical protein
MSKSHASFYIVEYMKDPLRRHLYPLHRHLSPQPATGPGQRWRCRIPDDLVVNGLGRDKRGSRAAKILVLPMGGV